ncbi:UPF0280 family protein [Aquabacterium sp. J223]|uniref:UPF0280 family protein n=1 Tax=Aquabacterium sp. J223 TaxID=2898431 RepID=UPI0021AD9381|nr:UPF0280 family protein [Aquabacterium sp. J223]UUX95193.1 UPF0280 family protein [Aquabacterium sp. J223]
MPAARALLPDGRWHFHHGPMDIVLGADGEAAAVAAAHEAAWQRFRPLLDELVAELPALKAPVSADPCPLQGPVAAAMWRACRPHRSVFITPMAAVAGAVADALIAAYRRPGVRRAWANNGGDIALHLTPGATLTVGLFSDLARLDAERLRQGPQADRAFEVGHALPVRGVATSGWRGRSLSLGIADSVTVLAADAARADAVATVIANAVDVEHPGIRRRPAHEVKDGSDLGSLPVTVDVAALPSPLVHQALERGASCARTLIARGLVHAAVLVCQGRLRRCGPLDHADAPAPKLVQSLLNEH